MIKVILKFVFAGGIIFWLFSKGQLDFSMVPKSLNHKLEWIVCIACLLVNMSITAHRWKILLQIKTDKKLPMLPMIKLTWIGMFFSSILPGAVTGDLVKILYAKDLDKNFSKTFLLSSVFIDRVMGLIGLLLLLGISSIFSYDQIISISPEVKSLVHFNFLLFLGAVLFLISLFLPTRLQSMILKKIELIPAVGAKFSNLFQQIWLIGRHRLKVFQCILSGTLSQTMNIFIFWFLTAPFFETPIPVWHAYTFFPIGLITIAIPVAPSGLGIGHAAFGKLFAFFGTSNGASLFNLYFIAMVFVNLMGSFPYILGGKRHTLKEGEELQTAS